MLNPLMSLDLVPLPISEQVNFDSKKKAEYVHQLHEKAQANIEKWTLQYATQANKGCKCVMLEPGNWVWLHM